MTNKKTLLFKLALFILMILCLQSTLFRLNAETAEIREQGLNAYPDTPKGVVEAFCKEDFTSGGDYWEMLQKYTVWEDSPGWDITVLVASYKVEKISEDFETAAVRVEYNVVGEYYYDDIAPVFKKTQSKENLIYKLTKKDGLWKIESPQEPPHFDAQVIVRDLEELVTVEKNLHKLNRIRKILSDLEAALANAQ